jgi:hypothetical protein
MYAALTGLSMVVPAVLLYKVAFDPVTRALLAESYPTDHVDGDRAQAMLALLLVGALVLWLVIFVIAFVGPLRRHRTGDKELVADLERLESELAELRRSDPSRDKHPSAITVGGPHGPGWWWGFHQLAVSVIYVLMIYPVWYAQRWLPPPLGLLVVLVVLASAAAGTSLRLHVRFVARYSPSEVPWQLRRSSRWTRACDGVFAAALVVAALGIGTAHPEFAMLFVAAATVLLVAALVIEPATARTAFSTEQTEEWRCPSCGKWRSEPRAERCIQCKKDSQEQKQSA